MNTVRQVFRIGEVFPSESAVACFLVSLSAGLNDLLFVNRLLVPEDDPLLAKDLKGGESIYLYRAGVAHFWELLTLIRAARNHQEVQDFLGQLSPTGRQALAKLSGALDGSSEFPHLRAAVAHTRNKTWHYPLPTDRHLKAALDELSAYRGVLEFGETMATIRAHFADDVIMQFTAHYTQDEEELSALVSEIADLTVALIHFVQLAMNAFVASLPTGTIREYLPGEPIPDDEVPMVPREGNANQ